MAGPYPNPTPKIIAEQRTRLGEEDKKANEKGNRDSSNGDDATGAPTAAGAAAPRVDRADTALDLTGDGDDAAAAKAARSRVARAAGGVRAYEPARVETFTAVILVLLLAGVVACAAVLPYQGVRDADAANAAAGWRERLLRQTASMLVTGVGLSLAGAVIVCSLNLQGYVQPVGVVEQAFYIESIGSIV